MFVVAAQPKHEDNLYSMTDDDRGRYKHARLFLFHDVFVGEGSNFSLIFFSSFGQPGLQRKRKRECRLQYDSLNVKKSQNRAGQLA